MPKIHKTDVAIIGAGPVGLFAVFELGLLDLNCHLIDILDMPGGQCAQLYPEKPIYDIPAFPKITGQDLIKNLLQQIKPFNPKFHLGQVATSIKNIGKNEKSVDIWHLHTDKNTIIECTCIVIAAGGGYFTPKIPPIANIKNFENTSVFYRIENKNMFRNKHVVVAGGGDSALDWALTLSEITENLTLIHRRNDFRAAPLSIKKMRAKVAENKMTLNISQIKNVKGKDGMLTSIVLQNEEHREYEIKCDYLLPFYGLTMAPGPVANFGCALYQEKFIRVDTEKFETSIAQVFSIGDINYYPGKLKLILSGFHEAALMAQKAFAYCKPEQKIRFQYTTSSRTLQKKLCI